MVTYVAIGLCVLVLVGCLVTVRADVIWGHYRTDTPSARHPHPTPVDDVDQRGDGDD